MTLARRHCKLARFENPKKRKEWDGNLIEKRKRMYVPRKKEKKEKKLDFLSLI